MDTITYLQIKVSQLKELPGVVSKCLSAYSELYTTGGIQSTVEGEKIILDLQANACGDILVFYSPKKKNTTNTIVYVLNLIQSDTILEQQKDVALKLLRQKFNGLLALPVLLIGVLSFGLSFPYLWNNAKSISDLFTGEVTLAEILNSLLAVITLLALAFSKSIGFMLLKPIVYVIVRSIKMFRWIRNKKAAELHD